MNERRLDSLYAKHIFDGFFFLVFVFCCCCWIYVYLLRIVRQCSLKASFLRKVSKEPSILVMKQKLKSEINKKRAIERWSEKKHTHTPFQRFNKDSSVFVVASELPLHFFLVYKRNDIIKYNVDVYKFVFFLALKFAGICVLLPGFWCRFFSLHCFCSRFSGVFVSFSSSFTCVDIHLHWNESALKIVCAIQP